MRRWNVRKRRFTRRPWKRAGRYRRRPRYVARRPNLRVAGLQMGKNEWKSVDSVVFLEYGKTTDKLLLNGLVPGSGLSQRIGNKIRVRKVVADLTAMTKTAITDPQGGRVMLVYDKQTNAAAPSVSDVLDISLGINDENSPIKLENRSRFVILKDWHFRTSASGQAGEMVKRRLVWRGVLPTVYNNGAGGTVADIASGALYLMTIGSDAGDNGQLSGICRGRYDDS